MFWANYATLVILDNISLPIDILGLLEVKHLFEPGNIEEDSSWFVTWTK